MLKTIVTLVRGATFRAEEELADRSALLILDQQIRDSAIAIERAKRALSVAISPPAPTVFPKMCSSSSTISKRWPPDKKFARSPAPACKSPSGC